MNALCAALLLLASLPPAAPRAQTKDAGPPVSTAFAVLTKPLELKTAAAGQELSLRAIRDVAVDGRVVIPRGSQFLGRVTEVEAGERGAGRAVWIVVEKAVLKGGELPVQAIIVAVAAPGKDSLASDPIYGMMHSSEPTMAGATPGNARNSGTLAPGSKASASAAVATAEIKGAADEPLTLAADSQGALGYEGLSISWHLLAPPPVTVFTTRKKNVKLEAGTQVLLRMAPPRVPH